MTDIGVDLSPVTLPEIGADLGALDLGGADRKLRRLSAVERTWSLPPLPDEVKLDLTMDSKFAGDTDLGDFMRGLQGDVRQALNPRPDPVQLQTATTDDLLGLDADPDSTRNKVRRYWNAVVGAKPPEVTTTGAVEEIKRQGIARGLLDPSTPVDARWDPSLRGLSYDIGQDEFSRRLSGERPGAAPMDSAIEFIGDWTDPSTLGRVAIALDLFPDFGNIVDEKKDWGNKWRRWWQNKTSPTDFLDALTGPIDDIAVPIINDALIVAGVGGVISAGRLSYAAARTGMTLEGVYAARSAATVGRLTRWSRIGEEAAAASMARNATPGLVSQGLMRVGSGRGVLGLGTGISPTGAVGSRVFNAGYAMQQWRGLKSVQVAKTAVQGVARVGIAGTLESRLLPEGDFYRGDINNARDLDTFKRQRANNPILGAVEDVVELSMTPMSYFKPGAVTAPFRHAGELARRFAKVSTDAQVTQEVARGIGATLASPAARAAFDTDARRFGPSEALVRLMGGVEQGGRERAGAFTTWSTIIAAIDKDAVFRADRAISGSVARGDERLLVGGRFSRPAQWRRIYLSVRNGHIAKLVGVNFGDYDTALERLAAKASAGNPAGHNREYAAIKSMIDRGGPDKQKAVSHLNELINDHNLKRQGFAQELLKTLGPGDVETHVSRFFTNTEPQFWDNFLTANDELKRLFDAPGILDATPWMLDDAVEEAAAGSDDYIKLKGLGSPQQVRRGLRVDDDTARRIAKAYEDIPDDAINDPRVVESYQALAAETDEQYKYLTETLGVRVEFVDSDPYASTADMLADVKDNKVLKVWRTQPDQTHPLLTGEQNDRFRAVHDYFGHSALGNRFDRHGEEVAWARHARMFSPTARGAMTTETRGQNSWLNYSDHNVARRLEGLEGEFPEQRVGLLPDEFWARDDAYVLRPRYEEAFSPTGRRIGGLHPKDPSISVARALLGLHEENPHLAQKSWFAPLARDIQPGKGRFALAGKDRLDKQDALELLALVRFKEQMAEGLRWLEKNQGEQAKIVAAIRGTGKKPHELSAAEMNRLLEDVFAEAVPNMNPAQGNLFDDVVTPMNDFATPKVKLAGRSLRYASETDRYDDNVAKLRVKGKFGKPDYEAEVLTGLRSARESVEAEIVELAGRSVWNDFGIPGQWDLAKKKKELRALSNYLAARVTGLPKRVEDQIDALGYRVVHGAEYAMPKDVLNLVDPFTDVTKNEVRRMSLGTFVTQADEHTVGQAFSTKLRNNVVATLVRSGVVRGDNARRHLAGEEAPEISAVMAALFDTVRQRQNTTQKLLDEAYSTGGLRDKITANLTSMQAPLGLRDLSMPEIRHALEPLGITNQRTLNELYHSIKKSYDLGWKFNGMASLEDKVRSEGVLVAGLKFLGRTDVPNRLSSGARGALIGGGLGGVAGLATGATEGDLGGAVEGLGKGAAAGAVMGAFGDKLPRATLAAAAGATIGTVAGGEPGAVIGAAALGLPASTRRFGRKLAGMADASMGSSWYRYTYLPDALADMRNLLRFTLSPLFDLTRYTESMMMSKLVQLPDGVSLPAVNSLKSLRAEVRRAGKDPEAVIGEARRMWQASTAHHFGPDGEYGVLEDTERFFTQRGILSFSPKDWMAVTNYRLVKQGVKPADAERAVREIMAYGMGRSPLEKSVNFIFFPFSFQKKVVVNGAKWMAKDLTRTVMIHDALKTYDELNARYNLSERWKKHLPILRDLQKLNSVAYGLSPGEFGGINRPILNFFLPQMFAVGTTAEGKQAQALLDRMLPIYRDVDRMLDDLGKQGYAAFNSPTHQTQRSEVDEAYGYWSEFKGEIDRLAKEQGYTGGWQSVLRDPDLAPLRQLVDATKVELMNRYPAWGAELAKTASNIAEDRNEILQQTVSAQPGTVEADLAEFVGFADTIEEALRDAGISLRSNPEDVPVEVQQAVRQYAIELEQRGRGFGMLYDRYYERAWGPIHTELY